jgi:peptide/nickel transport system substrate-binding protein
MGVPEMTDHQWRYGDKAEMSRVFCKSFLRLVTFAAVLTMLVVFAAACGRATKETPGPQSTEVKRGGELVFARYEEPLSLDPASTADGGSTYVHEQVFDCLVKTDETGLKLVPALAEKWDISPDGLEYTFYLRDAKFSNGEPITSEDVVFSLGRAADTKISPYASLFSAVSHIEALDAKTVKITLKEPTAAFLSYVAVYTASIVPKAAFEADPDHFASKSVGSGAFMVDKYIRGDKVVLVPNPYYWKLGVDGKPLPYLDKVAIKYVPESNSRILGLRNGDFDVIDNLPYIEAKTLQKGAGSPGIVVAADKVFKIQYVYINHQKPPLNNKDFCLALNYATDRQSIMDTVYFGFGEIPNSYTAKMNFWDKTVELIPYDPEKAKELISTSGYDGKTLKIIVSAGNAVDKQIAQMLQQFWSGVGINTEIEQLDGGAAWDKMVAGDYDLSMSYIQSDITDDEELASLEGDYWAPGETYGFFTWYKNQEVADLLAKGRAEMNPEKRAGYYKQVQKIMYWDGYSVPLNFIPALTAHWDFVQNWRTIPMVWCWLDQVWLNK